MGEASIVYERYEIFYTTFDCSVYAELFICLALFPHCDTARGPDMARPPCASLCDLVVGQCGDAIQSKGGFGFDVDCLLSRCSRQVQGSEAHQ